MTSIALNTPIREESAIASLVGAAGHLADLRRQLEHAEDLSLEQMLEIMRELTRVAERIRAFELLLGDGTKGDALVANDAAGTMSG